MKSNDWKDRLGVMYSTNPDFQYNTGNEEEEETLPKEKQQLRIALDTVSYTHLTLPTIA